MLRGGIFGRIRCLWPSAHQGIFIIATRYILFRPRTIAIIPAPDFCKGTPHARLILHFFFTENTRICNKGLRGGIFGRIRCLWPSVHQGLFYYRHALHIVRALFDC
jgi:hypothetical protein